MIPSIDSFLRCAAGSHCLKALPVQSPLTAILLFKCLFLPILPQALSTYTVSIFSARQDLIYVSPRFQHRLPQPFLNSSGKGWVCSLASPRTTL